MGLPNRYGEDGLLDPKLNSDSEVADGAAGSGLIPPGVVRLLVGPGKTIDALDVLGPVVAVPQLGEDLLSGYHPDDRAEVAAHLRRITEHPGCVAHWDARVKAEQHWLWVYEYAVSHASQGYALVRVYAGSADAERKLQHPERASPLLGPWMGRPEFDAGTSAVLLIRLQGPHDAVYPRSAEASLLTERLAEWVGVLDDWHATASGECFAWLKHCPLPHAEQVARDVERDLVELLREVSDLRPRVEVISTQQYAALLRAGAAKPRSADSPQQVPSTVTTASLAAVLDPRRDEGLLLYAQPIVALEGASASRVIGIEFLLRVRDSTGRPCGPAERLLATEQHGQMLALDRWVISQAFGLLAQHRDTLAVLDFVNINLSALSLVTDDLLGHVLGQLVINRIPAEKICFEITETGAIADLALAGQLIESLQLRGCRFALDDFGSGLASFAHLRALPVDIVKLDGRLVSDPLRHLSVLRHLQSLGSSLGKRTVAEHVETPAALEIVRQLGVDFVQGFLLGRPECPTTLFPRLVSEAAALSG